MFLGAISGPKQLLFKELILGLENLIKKTPKTHMALGTDGV